MGPTSKADVNLNIYVTCILWGRRGKKLPCMPCRELLFVLSLSFLWTAHLLLYLRRICRQPKEFLVMPTLSALWSTSVGVAVFHRERACLLHYTGRFFHILCATHRFASSEDSMHSLNSDHALTLHQIWEQQWVVAQHSLFSWPGDTSKGFQHRRDTSWGLGKQR